MNIKVCGITEMKQLHQLEGLDIEFAGLIFFKDSARYAGDMIKGTELKKADLDLRKVGVFVDPELIEVLDAIDEYGIDVVQLHGNESPQICEDLSAEVEVIKAFRVEPGANIDRMIKPYDAVCDYYLFDSTGKKESLAENSAKFDWELLKNSKIEKPFFIGGGINPEDAELLLGFSHPDFFGVDLGLGFEKSPGLIDMAKLLKFKKEVSR